MRLIPPLLAALCLLPPLVHADDPEDAPMGVITLEARTERARAERRLGWHCASLLTRDWSLHRGRGCQDGSADQPADAARELPSRSLPTVITLEQLARN